MTNKLKLIATLILLFFTVACIKQEDSSIRIGLANMPANLDPRFATDAASWRVSRLLYQRLIDFDGARQAIPSLAHWKLITPTLYRFSLKQNREVFHDGSRLTSHDVKATYESVLNKQNNSPHQASVAMIKNIHAIDADTVDFELSKPDPLFPAYLVIGILPEKLIQQGHDFRRHPIGNGPLHFSTWPTEAELELVRNKDQIKIRFLHVKDPTVRALKLVRGEIDITQNDLQPELIQYLQKQDDLNIQQFPGSNFSYIGFNLEDKSLSNLNLRKAIAYGINRDEIIQYIFANSAKPAEALLPPDHWAGNPLLKGYHYEPEKARAIMAEMGYSIEKPLTLVYKTSSAPFRIRLATVYQAQLAKIGINLDIRSYDWGTFYGDIKNGRFQMYSLAWIGIKSPTIFHYALHSDMVPPNGANRGRYRNLTVDHTIDQAMMEIDLVKQAALYRQVQQILLDDLPYIPLWYENHTVVTRKFIKNYKVNSDGNYDGLVSAEKVS